MITLFQVTLFHFDYPQGLEDEFGGWVNEKMPDRFAEYADFAFNEFGSQVSQCPSEMDIRTICKRIWCEARL